MSARGIAFSVGTNGPQQFESDVIAYLQLRNADGAIRQDVAAACYTPSPETLRRPVIPNIVAYIFGSVSVAG